jgi:hypothetical protein
MKFKISFLVAFLSLSLTAIAQEDTTLSRIWTKLTYRVEPSKNLKIDLSGLYRDIASEEGIDRFISEVQVTSKASKTLSYSTEFRHYSMFDNQGGSQGLRHRIRVRLSVTKDYSLGRHELSVRYGIQHREVITGGGLTRTDARLRTVYTHNIKGTKWDPSVYTEYIGSINGGESQRLRLGMETGNKILAGKISVGYFYQHNFVESSTNYHTFSIGYRL